MANETGKKTAFISGASRGIGAGIARALAAEGYDLALSCETSEALLRDLASGLERDHRIKTACFVGDIADESHVLRIAAQTAKQLGDIDLLVNNAGISRMGLLQDMSLQDWERTLSVNLTSCFLLSKAFLPAMIRRQSGSIVNISSIWGVCGASCEAAYSASKGGMNAFTKALAKEVAPSHIQVNAIACGAADTQMNDHLSEQELQDFIDTIPAGRLATPEDIGHAVAAIPRIPYMTGQIIGVNGGYL